MLSHESTDNHLMVEAYRRQTKLLKVVNQLTTLLLNLTYDADIQEGILHSLGLLGECLPADRVQIWKNEVVKGELCFGLTYEWKSKYSMQFSSISKDLRFAYDDTPNWEEKLRRGDVFNTAVSSMSTSEQDFFGAYGIRTIVMTPLFLGQEFWGFFSVNDCQVEKTYTQEEIEQLSMAGFIMISTLVHQETAVRLLKALQEAKYANKLKNEFLDKLNYEMRSPLNIVLGLSEALLRDTQLPKAVIIEIEKIIQAGRSMFELVNGLINISKMDSSNTEVLSQPKTDVSLKKRRRNRRQISLPSARVLVVDDNITNLDVAKGILQTYDITVDCVTNGPEAISLIREAKVHYHAIFMDQMMPGMDGVKTTNLIRNSIGTEYARHIPIIALTANASDGSEHMFLERGFQAYITKPIDLSVLDEIIGKWIANQVKDNTVLGNKLSQSIPLSTLHIDQVQVEGIDIEVVKELYEEDVSMFFMILRSYLKNTPSVVESLRQISLRDLSQFTIQVHGLKGSSATIGAVDLSVRAKMLEERTKREKLTGTDYQDIALQNDYLIRETQNLLSRIQRFIDRIVIDQ